MDQEQGKYQTVSTDTLKDKNWVQCQELCFNFFLNRKYRDQPVTQHKSWLTLFFFFFTTVSVNGNHKGFSVSDTAVY